MSHLLDHQGVKDCTPKCVCVCVRVSLIIFGLWLRLWPFFLLVCVLCPPQPYLLWLSPRFVEKVIQSSLESDFIWLTRPQNKHKEHTNAHCQFHDVSFIKWCLHEAREKTKQQKKPTKVLYLYDDKRVECNFHVEISNKNRINKKQRIKYTKRRS